MEGALTVSAALDDAARRLATAGIEGGRREARLLVAHVLGLRTEALIADPARAVEKAARARLAALVERRVRREPMSHLLGRREFWSLDLCVTADVLDPRPDSETLVEAALEIFPDCDTPLDILDLGTGSGCLLLAVLSERPRARGIGIDVSPPALAVAEANAARLGLGARVRFRHGDWGADMDTRFDLILCNPPYVPAGEIDGLEPEVSRYEPRIALDGGADGLAAYRALAPQFKRLLRHPEGAVVLEVGAGQSAAVAALLRAAGLFVATERYDLAGVARCVVARAAAPFTKP